MKYTNITPSLGLELATGTQMADFTNDEVTALKQLAAEHRIAVVRKQNMDMQGQAEFGHRLGPLMSCPSNKPDLSEELVLIRTGPKSRAVAGQGWHSDVSSEAVPPGVFMLRMEVVSPSSEDTLF